MIVARDNLPPALCAMVEALCDGCVKAGVKVQCCDPDYDDGPTQDWFAYVYVEEHKAEVLAHKGFRGTAAAAIAALNRRAVSLAVAVLRADGYKVTP